MPAEIDEFLFQILASAVLRDQLIQLGPFNSLSEFLDGSNRFSFNT